MAGTGIELEVQGATEIAQRFGAVRIATTLQRSMRKATLLVERQAKINAGTVLHVRTGRLRSSITSRVDVAEGAVEGVVGTAVEYGRIHELGGVIPEHDIFPKNAQALHFFMGGHEVFAKSAHIPDVKMPARPYLKPAAEEMTPRITTMLGTDIVAEINVPGRGGA